MTDKISHCAEWNGQYCVCSSIVWAMQSDLCQFAKQSIYTKKCIFLRELERCDNIEINCEMKGEK